MLTNLSYINALVDYFVTDNSLELVDFGTGSVSFQTGVKKIEVTFDSSSVTICGDKKLALLRSEFPFDSQGRNYFSNIKELVSLVLHKENLVKNRIPKYKALPYETNPSVFELLKLRFQEKMTISEMSQKTGISYGRVSNLLAPYPIGIAKEKVNSIVVEYLNDPESFTTDSVSDRYSISKPHLCAILRPLKGR